MNGLIDQNVKKLGPTNELWILEIYQKNQYGWNKLTPKGDIPCPRTNHIAVSVKKSESQENTACIFIFGGMGDKGKLDDCYLLDPSEMKFTKLNYNLIFLIEK
jgi:hypothetical protein